MATNALATSWVTFSKTKKAAAQAYSVKKVFLEIPQNSQENTCARGSFLIKLQAWQETLF